MRHLDMEIPAPMEDKEILSRITNKPLPPAFEVPESYNQVNAILSYCSLPTIECSDSVHDKALVLQKIKESIGDIAFSDNTLEHLEKIQRYKKMEADCDMMEVELANLKVNTLQKFGDKSVGELAEMLGKLQEKCKKQSVQERHLNCRALVEDILNERSLDSLWFYRDMTRGAYLRQKLLEKLSGRVEDWAVVLSKVVKEHCSKVEDIGHELGMDRVALLKIIYSYSAKGVLEYDRLNDSVCIKESRSG